MSPSLATDRKNADALGHDARRHYWLAPRSDDAVGAGVLGQDAGEVAAVAAELVPLWTANVGLAKVHVCYFDYPDGYRALEYCRLGQDRPVLISTSDGDLQAFRPPGFRR